MYPIIKRWYYILSTIWVVFWFLNLFVIAPIEDTFFKSLKTFFYTDLLEYPDLILEFFVIMTLPIQILAIYLIVRKIIRLVKI